MVKKFGSLRAGRVEYDLSDNVTWFAAVGGGNSYVHRIFGLPTILNAAGDVSITPQNAIFNVDRFTAETGVGRISIRDPYPTPSPSRPAT